MAQKDYTQLVAEIIEKVGGKENVQGVTHCMTRLRFALADSSKESKELENIPGVLKVIHAGGQTQVVIGTHVHKVYDKLCEVGGFESKQAVEATEADAAEDVKAERKGLKQFFSSMVDGLTGSLTPILPLFIVAGIFMMVVTLFGPTHIGLIPEGSDVLTILTIVGDACYYFAPVFAAWSAACKFNASPVLAMIIACVMIHPTLLEIVSAGEPFTVFGIPMRLVNYTQAVIPIVITTWTLSKVEKLMKKIIPDMVRTMAVPVFTVLIMLPLALCVFGPACYYVMAAFADAILWLSAKVGIAAMAVIGATWTFIIIFGMHIPILTVVLPAAMEIGYDPVVFPASIACGMAGLGVSLGYALRVKGKEEKALAWQYLVTQVTANIGEPFLYGVLLRNKKVLIFNMIGGAIGGALMGIMHCRVFTFSGVGFPFLNPIRFGEDVVKAAIVSVIAVVIPLILCLIFGVDTKKKDVEKATA